MAEHELVDLDSRIAHTVSGASPVEGAEVDMRSEVALSVDTWSLLAVTVDVASSLTPLGEEV